MIRTMIENKPNRFIKSAYTYKNKNVLISKLKELLHQSNTLTANLLTDKESILKQINQLEINDLIIYFVRLKKLYAKKNLFSSITSRLIEKKNMLVLIDGCLKACLCFIDDTYDTSKISELNQLVLDLTKLEAEQALIDDLSKIIKINELRKLILAIEENYTADREYFYHHLKRDVIHLYDKSSRLIAFLNPTRLISELNTYNDFQKFLTDRLLISLADEYIFQYQYNAINSQLMALLLHKISPKNYPCIIEQQHFKEGACLDISELLYHDEDQLQNFLQKNLNNHRSLSQFKEEFFLNLIRIMQRLLLSNWDNVFFKVPNNPSKALLTNFRFLLSFLPLTTLRIECSNDIIDKLLPILGLSLLYNRQVEEVIINGKRYDYHLLKPAGEKLVAEIQSLTRKEYAHTLISGSTQEENSDQRVLVFPTCNLLVLNAKLNDISKRIQIIGNQLNSENIHFPKIAEEVNATINCLDTIINDIDTDTIGLLRSLKSIMTDFGANIDNLLIKIMNKIVPLATTLNIVDLMVILESALKRCVCQEAIRSNRANELFSIICIIYNIRPASFSVISQNILNTIPKTHPFYDQAIPVMATLRVLAAADEEDKQTAEKQLVTALTEFYSLSADLRFKHEGDIYICYYTLIGIKEISAERVDFTKDYSEAFLQAQYKVYIVLGVDEQRQELCIIRQEMLQQFCAIKRKTQEAKFSLSRIDQHEQDIKLLSNILGISLAVAKIVFADITNIYKLSIYQKLLDNKFSINELLNELNVSKALGINFNAVNQNNENIIIHLLKTDKKETAVALIPYVDFNMPSSNLPNYSPGLFGAPVDCPTLFTTLFIPAEKIGICWSIINKVLDNKRDLNINGRIEGKSLLQIAIDALEVTTVEKLLQHGAKPDVVSAPNINQYLQRFVGKHPNELAIERAQQSADDILNLLANFSVPQLNSGIQ